MSLPCKILGCKEPRATDEFCRHHAEAWNQSPELRRVVAVTQTALADFARRIGEHPRDLTNGVNNA